jgi:formamidopyrimidine-DNA glycosylase
VHYVRKHLVNRTIKTCEAFADDIVYGKVGCSSDVFQAHVTGRKVTGANQQGKYFYITFDKPPHAVLHLGMTGWMKYNTEETGYYRNPNAKEEGWPPRFVKFLLKCEAETIDGEAREAVECAFVDARRLARIRLVDCDADKIRDATPLKENGPDPVRDKEIVTMEWLAALLGKKRVPVKALLLDQANISGVGNWVADEVLYQARIHPEQYSNTFNDEQIKRLHNALIGVCTTAVEVLADNEQFPETWLMKHRWDKGKKGEDANRLPNGEKIVHLKVGGRTSAIVPSVQKKTAAVAGDVDPAELEDGDERPAKGRKRKSKAAADEEEEDEEAEEKPAAKKGRGGKKVKAEAADADNIAEPAAKKSGHSRGRTETKGVKEEEAEEVQANGGAEEEDDEPRSTRKAKATPKKAGAPPTPGSRRSARSRK